MSLLHKIVQVFYKIYKFQEAFKLLRIQRAYFVKAKDCFLLPQEGRSQSFKPLLSGFSQNSSYIFLQFVYIHLQSPQSESTNALPVRQVQSIYVIKTQTLRAISKVSEGELDQFHLGTRPFNVTLKRGFLFDEELMRNKNQPKFCQLSFALQVDFCKLCLYQPLFIHLITYSETHGK